MNALLAKGVVLTSIPYGERQQIATLFCGDYGLVSFIVRNRTATRNGPPPTVLLEAEYVLQKQRGTLLRCVDASGYRLRPRLRQNLEALRAALYMADALRQTQLPDQSAQPLYLLFTRFLDSLPDGVADQLLVSFLMKLLHYEGMLTLDDHCCTCKASLSDVYLSDQGCHCRDHRPHYSIHASETTYAELRTLTYHRSLQFLRDTLIQPETIATGKRLFAFHVPSSALTKSTL